jgi:hypothetical protein
MNEAYNYLNNIIRESIQLPMLDEVKEIIDENYVSIDPKEFMVILRNIAEILQKKEKEFQLDDGDLRVLLRKVFESGIW